MAILRTEMSFRRHLQLVLMSATLNSAHLQEYMSQCPVITVPGRLFPVAVHYMNDINAIIKSQQKIHSEGGVSRVVKEDIMLSAASSKSPRKKMKKPAYKGKKPSLAAQKDDVMHGSNNILPRFNADTVAEFIIRLIEKENLSAKAAVGIKEANNAGKEAAPVIESKAILVFLYGIQPITAVMNILRHRQMLEILKAKVK
jgi:HrpA-like RNA helicase